MYIIMIHTHFKSQRKQLFIFDKSCLWITYCKRVCLIHIHAQNYINLGWGIFRKWKLLLRKWSKTFFNIEDEEIHIYVFPMLIHNSSMKWDLSIFEYNYYIVVYLYDTPPTVTPVGYIDDYTWVVFQLTFLPSPRTQKQLSSKNLTSNFPRSLNVGLNTGLEILSM